MSLALQAAEAFATQYHNLQLYGDKHPYTYHLAQVVEVLLRFQVTDEDVLVAGWLHDSLEDTVASKFQLEVTFGARVADLVFRVTNESGKNRHERHEKTYPKIQESQDAITLKLADRIANIEFSISDQNEGKLEMYSKEYREFRQKLHTSGTHDAMWRHLDFLIGWDGYGTLRDLK